MQSKRKIGKKRYGIEGKADVISRLEKGEQNVALTHSQYFVCTSYDMVRGGLEKVSSQELQTNTVQLQ